MVAEFEFYVKQALANIDIYNIEKTCINIKESTLNKKVKNEK